MTLRKDILKLWVVKAASFTQVSWEKEKCSKLFVWKNVFSIMLMVKHSFVFMLCISCVLPEPNWKVRFRLGQTIFIDNVQDVLKSLVTSYHDSGIKRQSISQRNLDVKIGVRIQIFT